MSMAIRTTLAFLTLSLCGCECRTPNRTKPEDAAKAWATSMGLAFKGASCAQFDTDNDGYVSCSVATQEVDRPVVITGLQCARLHVEGTEYCTAGCKLDSQKTAGSR